MSTTLRAMLIAVAGTMLLSFVPCSLEAQEDGAILAFGNLPPNRTVLIGEVVSAEHGKLITPYGRESVRPLLKVVVKNVLYGHANAVEDFWGQNTFECKDGRWMPRVVVGSSWLVPGNTALLMIDDFDGFTSSSGAPLIVRQIRGAKYLMDADPADDSVLYSFVGADIDWAAGVMTNPSASLGEVMGSVHQRFESTHSTLADARRLVSVAGGGQ